MCLREKSFKIIQPGLSLGYQLLPQFSAGDGYFLSDHHLGALLYDFTFHNFFCNKCLRDLDVSNAFPKWGHVYTSCFRNNSTGVWNWPMCSSMKSKTSSQPNLTKNYGYIRWQVSPALFWGGFLAAHPIWNGKVAQVALSLVYFSALMLNSNMWLTHDTSSVFYFLHGQCYMSQQRKVMPFQVSRNHKITSYILILPGLSYTFTHIETL